MENAILAQQYRNTKFCPTCHRIETGIVQGNGMIRLPCGTITKAERKRRQLT